MGPGGQLRRGGGESESQGDLVMASHIRSPQEEPRSLRNACWVGSGSGGSPSLGVMGLAALSQMGVLDNQEVGCDTTDKGGL